MDQMLQYAFRLVGTRYKWGGDNPISGFDCSGFVKELLSAAGVYPDGPKLNAQQLYDYYSRQPGTGIGLFGAGCLAFYGDDILHITHVAFMVNTNQVLEAGGGDHLTLTIDDADVKDAFVKLRLVKHRKDFLHTVKPSYAAMGLI